MTTPEGYGFHMYFAQKCKSLAYARLRAASPKVGGLNAPSLGAVGSLPKIVAARKGTLEKFGNPSIYAMVFFIVSRNCKGLSPFG